MYTVPLDQINKLIDLLIDVCIHTDWTSSQYGNSRHHRNDYLSKGTERIQLLCDVIIQLGKTPVITDHPLYW